MRAPAATAASTALALVAAGWLAYAARPSIEVIRQNHTSSAKDLLPVYLGAHALAAGRDPNDPQALRATFGELGVKAQVGGFFSYYPRTASLLAQPLRAAPFRDMVQPVRALLLASVIGAAIFGVLAGAAGAPSEGRRSPARVGIVAAVALAVAAAAVSLRITMPIVRIAQPGPLVALVAAVGLWALARGRDVTAGVAIALGTGFKFAPALLFVPALGARRWRVALAGGAVAALLALGMAYFHAFDAGDAEARVADVGRFLFPPLAPSWEPPLVPLWRARVAVVPLTALLLLWAAWRRRPAAAAGAVALAGGAVVLAGTHMLHEAIHVVPVLGWVVGSALRPGAPRAAWIAPIALVGVGVVAGTVSAAGNAPSLAFVPLATAAWLACAVRLVRGAEAGLNVV